MTVFQSRRITVPLALVLLALLLVAGPGRPRIAHATATFTVNDAGDANDFSPGNGVCETASGNGVCTLRAAITESDALAGADAINFAIGGGGSLATVSPASLLPYISDAVTIDGSTQCLPSYCFVGIQLSGVSCPSSCYWGLGMGANTTVTGMVINDFVFGAGIAIGNASFPSSSSANIVTNNFIGTDVTASSARPNAAGVIISASSSNTIGPGNTISGNTYLGVWITACFPAPFTASGCLATDSNIIESNAIGTNGCCSFAVPNGAGVVIDGAVGVTTTANKVGVGPSLGNTIAGNIGPGVLIRGASGNSVTVGPIGFSGSSAIPNGGAGVEIDGTASQGATGNIIGCNTFACGGIGIGGNTSHGIYIHGANASGNIVAHASIGETCPGDCATTAIAIPNGGHGIYLSGGAHDNRAGYPGLAALYGNDIGFNAGAGVAVDGGGSGNQVFTTTTHGNGGLGQDIEPVAPIGTAQNAAAFAPYITPQFDGALTSALYCPGCAGGGLLAITGYSRQAPLGSYVVDVYRNLTCDPSGYGEADLPILSGTWYVPASATTTDANGNTSGAGALSGYSNIVGQNIVSRATHWLLPNLSPAGGATGELGACLPVLLDSDNDGAENSIDTGGAGCFSDGGLPPTFGCIVDRNTGSSNPADDCYVSVVDRPAPEGVVLGSVCPASPGASVTVSMCGLGTVTLGDGGSQVDTCGSFRSGNNAVPADFDFSPVGQEGQFVLHQGVGTTSIVADVGSISQPAFSVLNFASPASLYPVTITLGTQFHSLSLPPDSSIITTVLGPQKFRVENTSSSVMITANGHPIPAGATVTLVTDLDADGCEDTVEATLIPPTSSGNPWDFFSVPVPALFAASNPLVVFKDGNVSAGDAQAIFAYFKKSAHTGNSYYEQDLNANGIKDGVEYDRTVAGPGQSGPPDGVVSAQDAQLAFAQFKRGYHC